MSEFFVTDRNEAIEILECAADLLANGDACELSAITMAVRRRLVGQVPSSKIPMAQLDLIHEIRGDIVALEERYGDEHNRARQSPESRIESLLKTAAALRGQERAA